MVVPTHDWSMWQVMVSLVVVGILPWVLPLVGALVGGATSIWGAKKKADAAKEAAKTQAASADKAMALERQMYEQNRQDLSPWYNVGATPSRRWATSRASGRFRGLPWEEERQATTSGMGFRPSGRLSATTGQPIVRTPLTQDVTDEELETRVPKRLVLSDLQANRAQSQRARGYAMMQAPDGSTQPVPVSQVPWCQEKGATLIGGGGLA